MDKKVQLIAVANDTLKIINQGQYKNKKQETVSIKAEMDSAMRNSILYSPSKLNSLKVESNNDFSTVIEVTGETTLAAAKRLKEEGFNKVCSLNFASARTPGGGFLKGSVAQEESLARASGLYPTINQMQEMYKYNQSQSSALYSNYMGYSPNVPVFKDDNGNLLDNFYTTSFITSAAPNAGVVRDREPHNLKKVDQVLKDRIEKILMVALANREETLVLGAFGCGVFKNNPYTVANIFKGFLNDAKFQKQFKKVVFAVYDTTRDQNVLKTFKSIIGTKR